MKPILLIINLLVITANMTAQLSGVITSEDGDTLSYASVYVEGTAKGTIANSQGNYSLDLQPGTYSIVYQYIGFEKEVMSIRIATEEVVNNVVLRESSYLLNDVVINADAEDPAYQIIRNAIKNRDKNQNLIQSYTANVYVKGMVKMLDAPMSFLGQDIGDLDGILDDSTRQGILYLSESQSRITFERPDKIKEEMYSSIVSGSDNGINANQFNDARFDFYDEYQDFNRSLVSPIADNAFRYYRFRLVGTTFDPDGSLINKIKVIPKSDYQPVYRGLIYIYDDTWSIHSVDLKFTGKNISQKIFDTISIQQIFVPIEGFDGHPLISQMMKFDASMLGFKIGGTFNYIFSDYNINEEIDDKIFTAELFSMTEDAVVSDSAFWENVRPIPLTNEEKLDYVKKDSLKTIWESKSYLDSLDQENNKFKSMDILFGYNYNNSFKKREYSYSSPLNSYQFNAVEGNTVAIAFEAKLLDSTENKQLKIKPELRYGFADKKMKFSAKMRYRFDRKNRGFVSLNGGREYQQLDSRNPVLVGINTLYSLFAKRNLMQLYDKRYISSTWEREVLNGLYTYVSASYENRRPLQNNSDYSWGRKERIYRPNDEIGKDDYLANYSLPEHEAFIFGVKLLWLPGQKYMSFPNFKSRVESNAPRIVIDYKKGFGDVDYDRLVMKVYDKKVNTNIYGYSAYTIEGGVFISDDKLEIPDIFHFKGNESFVNLASQNLSSFKLMPQYVYSTTDHYAAAFYEHHFDGFIADRIKLLRSIGAKIVVGGNMMAYKDQYYYEYSVGIENIGIGPFTLFRVDYAWAKDKYQFSDHGFMIGLSQMFE